MVRAGAAGWSARSGRLFGGGEDRYVRIARSAAFVALRSPVRFLELNDGEQVGVDLILVRCAHPVRLRPCRPCVASLSSFDDSIAESAIGTSALSTGPLR